VFRLLAATFAVPALLALAGTVGASALPPGSGGAQPPPTSTVPAPSPSTSYEQVRWRRSRAVGVPWRGRLIRGVRIPSQGPDWFTWDPVLERVPNRWWRRYGHDRLVGTLLAVLSQHRAANPGAPRVGVGDLSRPRGGGFGARFGGLGHASHQNGLDADVYYPRLDRMELSPFRARRIDRALAQDLVDRFVAAGAQRIFVGPGTGLVGPRRIVQRLTHHDDHLHVRLRPRRGGR
jgi:murein endopeptidase